MKTAEFEQCPGCGRNSESTAGESGYVVASCSKCGFSATTRDVANVEYLANFVPLPSIRTAARRIAKREPLNYSAARRR